MKEIHNDVKNQSEDALQQKCYFWFWNHYDGLRGLLFSVPNGGNRNAREGKKMNLTGVVSGVSDLIFLYHTQAYLIEIKTDRKGSSQSKNQVIWQKTVERQGFNYFIVRSLIDFKRLMNQLIVG